MNFKSVWCPNSTTHCFKPVEMCKLLPLLKTILFVTIHTDCTFARHAQKPKKEEVQEKWKWWEEAGDNKDNSVKWAFLEHKGPVFAPPYEPLPDDVHFKYDGKCGILLFREAS